MDLAMQVESNPWRPGASIKEGFFVPAHPGHKGGWWGACCCARCGQPCSAWSGRPAVRGQGKTLRPRPALPGAAMQAGPYRAAKGGGG